MTNTKNLYRFCDKKKIRGKYWDMRHDKQFLKEGKVQ